MPQPSDMIVYDSSLRPSTQKSIVRKWADLVTMGGATDLLRTSEKALGVGHVASFLHSVRASGESLITGGLLGAVSGSGGLDRKGVPVDLAGGVAAIGAGVVLAHSELGITLRTAGHTAMGIYGFRKTEEWLGVRKKASFAGDDDMGESIDTDGFDAGADPIVAAAQAL